jgi:phosphohistidine phosphatase
MRDYLDAEGVRPELALCSSALRARQTLARVLPALGTELEVRIEPALNTFDAEVVLERLGRLAPDVTSVLLVGHYPRYRISRSGSPSADRLGGLARKPTAGLAEIVFGDKPRKTLAAQSGELVRFVVPRDLDGSAHV